MVYEKIRGTFRRMNLTNESAEHLAKREDFSAFAVNTWIWRPRVVLSKSHSKQAVEVAQRKAKLIQSVMA